MGYAFASALFICIDPREKGCSNTPKSVKKFPGDDVLNNFVLSLANSGLIPPLTVSSCVTASVAKLSRRSLYCAAKPRLVLLSI